MATDGQRSLQERVAGTQQITSTRQELGLPQVAPTPALPGLQPEKLPTGAKPKQKPPEPGKVPQVENLPQLPPTVARALDEQGLSHKKQDFRIKLAEGGKSAPDEKAKILALASHYDKSESFRKKVDDAYAGGRLEGLALSRVEAVKGLSDALKNVPEEERYPGLLSDVAEQAIVGALPVGPEGGKVRVSLIRNPQTGASSVDVQSTFAQLQSAYLTKNKKEGMSTAEALKAATERASDDLIGIALTGRRILMWDPTETEEKVASMADDLPGLRTMRAHMARVGGKSLFHPTADDLSKEGALDWFLRMSPFDFQANKLKLIREEVYKGEHTPTEFGKVALALTSMINPAMNETVLERMGVSIEDQIKQHISGYTWLEEGLEILGGASYQFAKATGASEEEAEVARQNTKRSKAALAVVFIPYLFDPDLATLTLLGAGKGAKLGVAYSRVAKLDRSADLAKKLAENPAMRADEALDELSRVNPDLADNLRLHILSATQKRGMKDIANLEASIPERMAFQKEKLAELAEKFPGIDIDNFDDLVRIRNEPGVQEALKSQIDFLIQSAAQAETHLVRVSKVTSTKKKVLSGIRKEARAINDASEAVVKDGNEILKLIIENPTLRPAVAAHNSSVALQGELRAAKMLEKTPENLERISAVENRLKAAQQELKRAMKDVDPALRDRYLELWTHGREVSKVIQRSGKLAISEDLFTGADKFDEYVKDKLQALARVSSSAKSQLNPLMARYYALYPDEYKAYLKAAKKGKEADVATRTTKAVLAGKAQEISNLRTAINRVKEAEDAAAWRKIVIETAESQKRGAAKLKKDTLWTGLGRPKTGIVDLDTATAQTSIVSRLSRAAEGPTATAGALGTKIANFKWRLRTPDATGRTVILDAPEISGSASKADEAAAGGEPFGPVGRVSTAQPDVLRVEDIRFPKAIKEYDDWGGSDFQAQFILEALRTQKATGKGVVFAKKLDEAVEPLINAGLPGRRAANGDYIVRADDLTDASLEKVLGGVRAQGVVLDLAGGSKLGEELVEHYGKDAVEWAIERGGRSGKLLERAIKENVIRLTAKDAEALQFDVPQILAQASKRLNPETREMLEALQVIQAGQARPWGNAKGLRGWVQRNVFHTLRSFDPFGVRIGENSDEVRDLLRAGDNLSDQATDEIRAIILQARKSSGAGSAMDRIVLYLDSGKPIPLPKNKTTVLNSGPKTHWQRMQRQVKGWAKGEEELARAAGKSPEEATAYKPETEAQNAVQENHPSILGLSRVWLPAGKGFTQGQAAQLYKEAQKHILESSTFDEFMRRMKKSTEIVGREGVDSRNARVYMLAAKAVTYGSIQDELAYLARRASGGVITTDEMLDANRILQKEYDKVEDVGKALDTLNRVGIPFTQRVVKPTQAAGMEAITGGLSDVSALNRQLVRLGTDDSGQAIFAAASVRRELATSLNRHIKELYEWSEKPRDEASRSVVQAFLKFLHLMRTDATIGIALPNPGHHVFNRIGDATQMMFSLPGRGGLAARATFQNVWTDIPVFGRAIQDGLSQMSRNLGGKPVLKSLTETMFNPHLDNFWRGEQGVLQLGKDGPFVSYDWLRKRAVKDGIMDVFLAEELADTLRRLPDDFKTFERYPVQAMKSWQENIAQFTIATQQRQRIGTWMMLLNDGHKVDDATRLVHESLYDWAHGMSRAELGAQLRVFPYYRFWRLAMGQLSQSILSPISKPTSEVLQNALTGSTRLNKLRVQMRAARDVTPWLFDPRSPEEIAEEEGEYAAWARALLPEWIHPNPVGGITPIDHRDHFAWGGMHGQRGGEFTHTVGILPPFTMVDAAEVAVTPMMAAVGVALAVKGETEMADDWFQKATTPIADLLYPSLREYVLAQTGARPAPRGGAGDLTVIQPYEADVARQMGIEVVQDPETGRYYAPLGAQRTLFRMVPVVGIGVPRLLNAAKYRNPDAAKGVQEGLSTFFLNWTRLYRQYPYNYKEELVARQRRMSKAVNQRMRKAQLVEPD